MVSWSPPTVEMRERFLMLPEVEYNEGQVHDSLGDLKRMKDHLQATGNPAFEVSG